MNENELQEFIESARSVNLDGKISGFNGVVKIRFGIYKSMTFECKSVTGSRTVYTSGNHRFVLSYKNIGDKWFPNYVNIQGHYFKPVSELVERPVI